MVSRFSCQIPMQSQQQSGVLSVAEVCIHIMLILQFTLCVKLYEGVWGLVAELQGVPAMWVISHQGAGLTEQVLGLFPLDT